MTPPLVVQHITASWHENQPLVTRPLVIPPDGSSPEPHLERCPIALVLGSLGGADVDLTQRLVDVLAYSPHRLIVSMSPYANKDQAGRQHDPGRRCCRKPASSRSSTSSSPVAASTPPRRRCTSAPMIVLPLFWDQYDNAQRRHELGFGIRLAAYEFTPGELNAAVETLLADTDLRYRLDQVGARIRQRERPSPRARASSNASGSKQPAPRRALVRRPRRMVPAAACPSGRTKRPRRGGLRGRLGW